MINEYSLVFCGALLITMAITPVVIRLALWLGAVDPPREGRLHTRPMARAGGIAVFLGFHLVCAGIFLLPMESASGIIDPPLWTVFVCASSSMLLLGLLDDIFDLSHPIKLIGQVAIASFMLLAGLRFGDLCGGWLPVWLDLPVSLCFYLLIINAFHQLDGWDGLATGVASIAVCGILGTFVARGLQIESMLALALLGACLGFLHFNSEPAKIFLGGSGGMLLGFTLASLVLAAAPEGDRLMAAGVPLLCLALPIVDIALACWRRSIRLALAYLMKQPRPGSTLGRDTEHVHHRLVEEGWSERDAVMQLYLWAALSGLIGMLSLQVGDHGWLLLGGSILATCAYVLSSFAHVEWQGSGLVLIYALGRQSRPALARILYVSGCFCGLALALAAAVSIAELDQPLGYDADALLFSLLICCALPAWFLVGRDAVDGKVRVAPLSKIAFCILGLTAIKLWFVTVFADVGMLEAIIESLVFAGLACVTLQALTLLPQAVENSILYGEDGADEGPRDNVLLYGTRQACREYMHSASDPGGPTAGAPCVIGMLHGGPGSEAPDSGGPAVLGGIGDIPRLLSSHTIDRIVLASEITMQAREEILRIASAHAVPVVEWEPEAREKRESA